MQFNSNQASLFILKKIISGGQTGVDEAALDAAIELGIPYAGKCPKGRINENGFISNRFAFLKEIKGEFKTEQENYDARTKKNIEKSDGTLIIVPLIPLPKNIQDGTLLTIKEVQQQEKPHLLIDLSNSQDTNSTLIIDWLQKYNIALLNIAGPRESNAKGIYAASFELLKATLHHLQPTDVITLKKDPKHA